MDRIIIDNTFKYNCLTLNKNSYVIVKDDVETKDFEFNILDCEAIIIDMSNSINKTFNFKNSKATIVEIVNDLVAKSLNLNNDNAEIEYNIIDLMNSNITYSIKKQLQPTVANR